MRDNPGFSDEFLNSFADNELGASEKSEVLDAAGRDEVLRERVCELRRMKELVQHAYAETLPESRSRENVSHMTAWWQGQTRNVKRMAICATLLLTGGVSGWYLATGAGMQRDDMYAVYMSNVIKGGNTAAPQRSIVFQVSSANPIRLGAALDEAENLLEANKQSLGDFQVEIIANADGVNLLRADISPFGRRIALMKAKYSNLEFMACGRTVGNLRSRGVDVSLLPNINIASSAADEISRRLRQGWDYARM